MNANDNAKENDNKRFTFDQPRSLFQKSFQFVLSHLNDEPKNLTSIVDLLESIEGGQVDVWNKKILGSCKKNKIDLSELKKESPGITFSFLEWSNFGDIVMYQSYPKISSVTVLLRKELLISNFLKNLMRVSMAYASRKFVEDGILFFNDFADYWILEDPKICSLGFSADPDYMYLGYSNKIILCHRDSFHPIKEFALGFCPYDLFEIDKFLISRSALGGDIAFTRLDTNETKYFEGYFWGHAHTVFVSFDGQYVCIIGQHKVEVFKSNDLFGKPIVSLKNDTNIYNGSFIPMFPDILFLNSVKDDSYFYSVSLNKVIMKLVLPEKCTIQSIAFPNTSTMICKDEDPEDYIEVTLSPLLYDPQVLLSYLAIRQELARRQKKDIPEYLNISLN